MKKRLIAIFLTLIILSAIPYSIFAAEAGDTVKVGGMAFGLKFYTDGILVCGVSEVDTEEGNISPGELAGISKGDIIKKADGKVILSVNELIEITNISKGNEIKLEINRNGKDLTFKIKPVLSKSENCYKLGLWIKDGTAGIGTVTYIEEDNNFAGLGHGVCDIETGSLLKLMSADVCDVTITAVKAGKEGAPGELKGIISENITGQLQDNTVHGVYGYFEEAPESQRSCVIAQKGEITEGNATILCTLDDNNISEYEIEIEKIYNNSEKTKNFVIKVTDPDLISKASGIVQGMSGSPIIQNGKLVGAVTHVLVDDPTRGYGIFIENML